MFFDTRQNKQKKSKQPIHYLWVGSPTKLDPDSISGHDVAGPIEFTKEMERQSTAAECTKNPIKFWCFRNQQEFYQNQFKQEQANHIEVCAIENLIEVEKSSAVNESLRECAKFVDNYLLENPLDSVADRVMFKDLFSLFLLVSQGGYFFDTNVFPVPGKIITLPGEKEVMTAKSGFLQSNDFYMMYSPERAHPTMLKIFDAWKEHQGLGAFSEANVPYFDEKISCVKKTSYKSYIDQTISPGLFFWLSKPNIDSLMLETYLHYGDVNFQRAYPKSMKILEEGCQLCTHKVDVETFKKTWQSIPFQSDKAYISTGDWQIFYVDRSTNTCVEVYKGCTTLHDVFPRPYEKEKIITPQPASLERIIKSSIQTFYPTHIVNVDNCTLLHHAVVLNDIEKVKTLLKFKVRTDLQASYQIKEAGKEPTTVQMTPGELAAYLKHDVIAQLIAEHEVKQKTQHLSQKHPTGGEVSAVNDSEFKEVKESIENILSNEEENIRRDYEDKQGEGNKTDKPSEPSVEIRRVRKLV